MTPDSQQSQIVRLQQQVLDLKEVVGKFGQVLVDQVRMDEQLKSAHKRIDELEAGCDELDSKWQKRFDDELARGRFNRSLAWAAIPATAGVLIALATFLYMVLASGPG